MRARVAFLHCHCLIFFLHGVARHVGLRLFTDEGDIARRVWALMDCQHSFSSRFRVVNANFD